MIRYIPPQKPVLAERRRPDQYGAGHFGAPRGNRKHNGIDYTMAPGSAVLTVAAGHVTVIGYPYATGVGGVNESADPYRYVEIADEQGYRARYFYVQPAVGEGEFVCKGEEIGLLRSLRPRLPNITEHLHFEVRDPDGKIINPEQYFLIIKGRTNAPCNVPPDP